MVLKKLTSIKMHNQIFMSLIIGVLLGLFYPSGIGGYQFIGQLFVNALKFLIIPLVFASLITGILSLGESKSIGKIGGKALVLFLLSTAFSVCVGIVMALLMNPGIKAPFFKGSSFSVNSSPDISAIFLEIIPSNIVSSFASGNMLAIIFTALIFGLAISKLSSENRGPLAVFFESVNAMMMLITNWILAFSPLGILCLMAKLTATTGISSLLPLGLYLVTCILGLVIFSVGVMSGVLWLFGYQPAQLAKLMMTPLLTAFSTASSSATMPLVIQYLTEKVKLKPSIIGFVIPLGTTINMHGTALYQGVATLFIAQLYGVSLGLSQFAVIIAIASLAAIAAAGIPSAGLITLSMIVTAVGVPVEGIGVILAVDRLIDMVRTAVNVWGNIAIAAILDKLDID